MKNSDLGKIWEKVNKEHRHLPRNKAVIKNEEYLMDSLSSSDVSTQSINSILDWGPGGGWLTKICQPKKAHFLDIVPGFDKIIKKNLEENSIEENYYLLNDEGFPDISDDIDLAILYSVLYHMPSVKYVKSVIEHILKISPNNIAIRSVFTDGSSWDRKSSNEEYNNQNYLRGTVFNKDEFLSKFTENGYKISHYNVVQTSRNIKVDKSLQTFSSCILLKK